MVLGCIWREAALGARHLVGEGAPWTPSLGQAGRVDAVVGRSGGDLSEGGVEVARVVRVRARRVGKTEGRAGGRCCQF